MNLSWRDGFQFAMGQAFAGLLALIVIAALAGLTFLLVRLFLVQGVKGTPKPPPRPEPRPGVTPHFGAGEGKHPPGERAVP